MRRILMILLAAAAVPAAAQFRMPGSGQPGGGSPGIQPSAPAARPGLPGPAAASRGPQLVDRIVAIVNKEVITQRDLAERMRVVESQLKRQNTPLPPAEVLERQVLERMISDRVQVQYARETGVRADDLQVDRTVQMIAEQNRLSLPEFRAVLERQGVSYEKFRDDIRNEILISRLREREVDSKIQVAESEIDNFLQEVQSGAAGPAQFNIAHILVRVPENASPEQIEARRRRAADALARVRSGADFSEVAVSFSDAPDALQGGNMGWRDQDRLPELFSETLARLKPGEVSDILRSPAGFHLVKLNERRGGGGGGAFVVEQTHVRHILARVGDLVSEAEARRKIALLRTRIVQGANFAEIARLNSDDTASAQRGGDLGWIVPGDLVPEFERAAAALKPGELSEPVRTGFGFHLIEVIARRTADLSVDRKRLEARKVLRERRSDESYEEWLRQLRDRAYVEYRLEER